jgi:molybdopterin-guanine dinucleotide biosynthesis protein A
MGTDKASLPYQGRRLVEVMNDRLWGLAGISAVYVSGRVAGLSSIPDEHPRMGPLEGVRSVINELECRGEIFARFLIVPVDMPNLSTDQLCALLCASLDSNQAVRFIGFELPLLLASSQEVKRQLRELCSEERPGHERSFRQLLGQLKVLQLPVTDAAGEVPKVFLNANTPEDWERALL